jgi:hypothetical protein
LIKVCTKEKTRVMIGGSWHVRLALARLLLLLIYI